MAAAAGNHEPIVAINVTPFVDVVLVLLIIFMATSNYMTNPAIEVELPKAASGGETLEQSLAIVLTKDNRLYLNGEPIVRDVLSERCRSASQKNPAVQVMIAADGATRHEHLIGLVDLVKLNGITSFALSVEPTTLPAKP